MFDGRRRRRFARSSRKRRRRSGRLVRISAYMGGTFADPRAMKRPTEG
jgi:hypothetical protein